MSHAIYVGAVAQLACAFVAAGFSSAQANDTSEKTEECRREWGTAVDGQAVSIATNKSTYSPEEAITLNVVVKNIGQADVHFIEAMPLLMYTLTVVLPSGKEAPLTLYGKQATENWKDGSMSRRVLRPSEESIVNFALSRHFDLSLPGTYTIAVRRSVVVGKEDPVIVEAKSNVIEVTVRESVDMPFRRDIETRLEIDN